ncbi:MAG: hypothetical protein JWO44_1071 [Bacteroidetes bacterium]|nr:hypothetical protein [Bacteroidota bacterium]
MLFKDLEKKLFWLSITLIVAVSYRLYSSRYYALLNSDDALSILMTYYYQLPKDLYCWGQNRGGTLIPLVSQVFYRGLGFSPVNAVSLSNYLLLIIGFFGFSSLFRNRPTKVIFAMFWFLPPVWFVDILRFPYGVQYCLVGSAVFIINKLHIIPGERLRPRQHLLLLSLIVLFTATVWVSDLAAVTIVVLLFTLLLFHFFKNRFRLPHKMVLLYTVLGLAVCTCFILFAKNGTGYEKPEYMKINSAAEAFGGIRTTWKSLSDLLMFRINEPFMSVYTYLVLLLLPVILIAFYRQELRLSEDKKRWLFFFLADGLIIFTVILFSRWALVDGYGRRFFICSYISFGLAFLILTDQLMATGSRKNIFGAFLMLALLAGAASPPHFLKCIRPGNLKPTMEVMAEFKALGKCSIIGDYWSSYIVSIADPALITAIPHDHSNNKSPELVKEIFKGKYVYLIRNDWFETYPGELAQYWHLLRKDGNEFTISGKSLCRYKIIN